MRWQSFSQPLLACGFPSRHEGFAPVTFPYGNYFSNRSAPPPRLRPATRLEKRLFPAPLNCPPLTLPNRFVSGTLRETLSTTIRGAGGLLWFAIFVETRSKTDQTHREPLFSSMEIHRGSWRRVADRFWENSQRGRATVD